MPDGRGVAPHFSPKNLGSGPEQGKCNAGPALTLTVRVFDLGIEHADSVRVRECGYGVCTPLRKSAPVADRGGPLGFQNGGSTRMSDGRRKVERWKPSSTTVMTVATVVSAMAALIGALNGCSPT